MLDSSHFLFVQTTLTCQLVLGTQSESAVSAFYLMQVDCRSHKQLGCHLAPVGWASHVWLRLGPAKSVLDPGAVTSLLVL